MFVKQSCTTYSTTSRFTFADIWFFFIERITFKSYIRIVNRLQQYKLGNNYRVYDKHNVQNVARKVSNSFSIAACNVAWLCGECANTLSLGTPHKSRCNPHSNGGTQNNKIHCSSEYFTRHACTAKATMNFNTPVHYTTTHIQH